MFAVQLQQVGDIEVGSTYRDRKDSKQWFKKKKFLISIEGTIII